MDPLTSVIIVTYKREQDVIAAVNNVLGQKGYFEIVIIDNDPSSTLEKILPSAEKIRYLKQDKNLGCGGGRNAGALAARGEFLVFLDDDAEFRTDDVVLKVRDYFSSDPRIGCLAFQIRNYFTNEIDTKEFPHPNHSLFDKTMKVSYYVGAGHAIRQKAFAAAGRFMDLVYAHEELDYSFKMIKAGFELLYTPDIVVRHKVSQMGRSTNKKFIYYNVRNRYYVLARHLPLQYLLTNITFWNLVWLFRALRVSAFKEYTAAICHGIKFLSNQLRQGRQTVTKSQISYLKKNGGRLWY